MLYFAALLLPHKLSQEITRLKYEIKEKYNSKHALNSPPHITLLSPFTPETAQITNLKAILAQVANQYKPFDIQLNNISNFGDKVIFIDVKSSNYLFKLQNNIEKLAIDNQNVFNYRYKKRAFRPHISLAFRDLTQDNFKQAFPELKQLKFEQSFPTDGIYLLKKYEGMNWEKEAYFSFSK